MHSAGDVMLKSIMTSRGIMLANSVLIMQKDDTEVGLGQESLNFEWVWDDCAWVENCGSKIGVAEWHFSGVNIFLICGDRNEVTDALSKTYCSKNAQRDPHKLKESHGCSCSSSRTRLRIPVSRLGYVNIALLIDCTKSVLLTQTIRRLE